jgi:hypothetical protein
VWRSRELEFSGGEERAERLRPQSFSKVPIEQIETTWINIVGFLEIT